MATFEITGPDGSTYEIDAPDTATPQQLAGFAKQEFAKQQGAARKADAAAYAGSFAPEGDVSKMGTLARGLGGAKAAWDRGAYGLKAMIPGLELSDEEKQQLRQAEAFTHEAGTAAKVGEFAGDVAMTAAPALRGMRAVQAARAVLPRALGAAVANPVSAAALSGAAVGAATNPLDRKGGAIGGAVGGAVGEGAGRLLTRTLGGAMAGGVTPEARQLMSEGVDVPLWKATDSRAVRGLAERAKALPWVGDALKGRERQAIEQWNRNLVRDAMPPAPVLDDAGRVLRWERGEPIRERGQEAMEQLHNRFNAAYDALYEGRSIPVDDAFGAELRAIGEGVEYTPGAAPAVRGAIRRAEDTLRAGTETTRSASPILDEAGRPFVNEQLGHAGVSNANFKRALDELDDSIRSAWGRGDAEAARPLEAVRDAVQQLRERGLPPEVAHQLGDVNNAYANYKLLQRASGSIGAVRQGGVVTPAQVTTAVKAADRSVGKRLTTEGRARGQQAAQRAHNVLGSELPEVGPGTAEKLILASGLGGAAFGWGPVAAGTAGLLLTRQGNRFLQGGYGWQQLLQSNPQLAANILRSGAIAGNQ